MDDLGELSLRGDGIFSQHVFLLNSMFSRRFRRILLPFSSSFFFIGGSEGIGVGCSGVIHLEPCHISFAW